MGTRSEYYFIHLDFPNFPSQRGRTNSSRKLFLLWNQATADTEHVYRHQLHSSRCCTFKSWWFNHLSQTDYWRWRNYARFSTVLCPKQCSAEWKQQCQRHVVAFYRTIFGRHYWCCIGTYPAHHRNGQQWPRFGASSKHSRPSLTVATF